MRVCRRFLLLAAMLVLDHAAPTRGADWPQWLGPARDGVWRETGILDKFPQGGPKVLWRQQIGGGFCGPAVAGGRVFVMDRQGEQLPKGKEAPPKGAGLAGKERILCLSAADGKEIWKHEYDCAYKVLLPNGPRATPTVHDGKVYTLGAMGHMHCLDAATGKVHWTKNLLDDYQIKPPLWGYAGHLLVDGDKVFSLVGGEGSAVVALDRNSGKEIWKALTVKEVGYAPPMIFDAGGARQLIVWHTEALNALDPATGSVHWSIKFPEGEPERPGIAAATPRKVGDYLFVSCPHHGSLMIRLDKNKPAAKELWRGKSENLVQTEGLHALMNSPIVQDGHVYGVCNFGELRCLKADTGERVWEHLTTAKKRLSANTFLVPHGDRVFLFSDQGELIIARLSAKGYQEIDRAKVLEPNLSSRGTDVVWSHPAFANQCMFARNESQIVCIALKAS